MDGGLRIWGIALILSGFFIAFALIKYGISQLRINELNVEKNDWRLGSWWDFVLKYFVPPAAIVLLIWWLGQSAFIYAPNQWYNPFNPYSVMTCLAQWFIMLGVFIWNNCRIANRMLVDVNLQNKQSPP
jgi:NSS family neurotransmitter:Na+ symporter